MESRPWVDKDAIMNERVGWRCEEHGWAYWVRLIQLDMPGKNKEIEQPTRPKNEESVDLSQQLLGAMKSLWRG